MLIRSLLLVLTIMFLVSGCVQYPSENPVNLIEGDYLMNNPVINSEGGYEIRPLKNFTVKMAAASLTMLPANGDISSGPAMFMTMEKFSSPVDLNTAASALKKNEPAYKFSREIEMDIDGNPARSMNFTSLYHAPDGIILENPGASEGEALQGRVVITVYQDVRLFKCVMLSPEKTWGTYEPAFMAAIKTLRFINPKE